MLLRDSTIRNVTQIHAVRVFGIWGLIYNKASLVQMAAWHRLGNKLLLYVATADMRHMPEKRKNVIVPPYICLGNIAVSCHI